jgi:hypothetical protein
MRKVTYPKLEKDVKDLSTLEEWSAKKLRTFKMSLNNRMESFKSKGNSAPDLQKSNVLYGLTEEECRDLLKKVQDLLKIKKNS